MRKRALSRNILISLFVFLAITAIAVFFYRISIIQYTAETVIRNVLPPYMNVEKISFDIKSSRVSLKGLSISNPPGFRSNQFLEVEEASCRYRMRGKSMLDGIEIIEPVFKRSVLRIDRNRDRRLNLDEMPKVLSATHPVDEHGFPATLKAAREQARARGVAAGRAAGASTMAGNRKFPDIVKLPESYDIRNGEIIYDDEAAPGGAHTLIFDGIEGQLSLRLDDRYTRVLRVSSAGEGFFNRDKRERVGWVIDMDPTAARLTMSNRFNVSNVQIKPFEPYYDRYSPLIFHSGRFSGTLVFDFDNGNIGSTNEIRLSGISFSVKPGAENKAFWTSTVPDLVKYFRSTSGEIVFDFKIKGEMSDPKFYFGPISKAAITAMAVDKISAAIAEGAAQSYGAPAESKEAAQARAIANAVKLLFEKSR